MTALIQLPIFGPEHASCDSCELKPQCGAGKFCTAYRPEKFNGIMIVGEGPGNQEVIEGRPFVGPAGRLLRATLKSVGLELEECYITNATLCKPPPKNQALQEAFPNAVPSCLGRLEAEIEAVKPKVIVALGAAAWIALSGYDQHKTKQTPFECEHCNEQRKVGPVLQCSARVASADGTKGEPCHHIHFLKGTSKLDVDVAELEKVREAGCQKCGSKLKRSTPKMIKCLHCGGRKTRTEEYDVFTWDLNISKAAGGIFEPAPDGATTRKVHEIDPWYRTQGVQYVIPTFHPSHILRGQQFLAKAMQKHFAKAKRLRDGGRPIAIKYKIVKDPQELLDYVYGRDMWSSHYKWRERHGISPNFACDTETHSAIEGGDAREIYEVTHIDCIGIGTTEDAIVVDTREVNPDDPNDPLLSALYQFITDVELPKTYHHGAGYDVIVIDKIWGIPWDEQIKSYDDDSMFGHINLYPDEPHDLGHVTFEFVDARAWKPPRTSGGAQVFENFEEKALYNARDTIHTARAKVGLGVDRGKALPGDRMARAGLSKIYDMDCRLRKVGLGMTMRGMPLDKAKFAAAGQTSRDNIAAARVDIQQALVDAGFGGVDHRGGDGAPIEIDPATQQPVPCACRACQFNPNSGPQIINLLYGRDSYFNLPVLDVTKTNAPSTSIVTLQKLLGITKNEFALKFLLGKVRLLKHNYVDKNFVSSPSMQPWADGRIHAIWKQWGARTGRFSSSPNCQNWPKWLRSCVVTGDGRVIFGIDYDQLELRGSGWLTGDKELIRRCITADDQRKLEPECDPHSYVASLAFSSRYTGLNLKDPAHDKADPKCACETCRRKALRDITKRVIYGLNYGAGEATVLEAIYNGGYEGPPITIDMVAHVKRTVFKAFPGVEAWREEAVKIAMRDGELRSPIFGRRRIFPLNEVPVTEIYNYPIQSLGADVINEATLIFEPQLQDIDPTAFLFAQVHDALYGECSEDRVDQVCAALDDAFNVEYERNGIVMPFTASASYAKDWKAAA